MVWMGCECLLTRWSCCLLVAFCFLLLACAGATGVDVSHKAKGKLSALELAKKRKRERAGSIIARLLADKDDSADADADAAPGAQGSSSSSSKAASGLWEDWAPADDKWRELLKNDPFAKSALGGEV